MVARLIMVTVLALVLFSAGCNKKGADETAAGTQKAVVYTCTMHPEIQQDQPGKCPICGMDLVKKE